MLGKLKKIGVITSLALSVGLLLFSTISTMLFANVQQVSAATNSYVWTYSDSKGSSIIGPTFTYTGSGQYTPNNAQTYKNVSAGKYQAGNFVIITKSGKNGDPNATYYPAIGGADIGKQIPVGPYSQGDITVQPASSSVATFVDHSNITFQGVTYTDDKIDDNLTFKATSGDSCTAKSSIDSFNHQGNDTRNATDNPAATAHIYSIPGGGNNNCIETDIPISFDNASKNNYQTYFKWEDGGTIATSDEGTYVFTGTGTDGKYLVTDGGEADSQCQAELDAKPGDSTGKLILRVSSDRALHEGWPDNISGAPLNSDGSGCKQSDPITVTLGSVSNSSKQAGSSTLGQKAAGKTGANANPSVSCENKIGLSDALHPGALIGKGINWIVCNIIRAVNGAINYFDTLINSELEFSSNKLESTPGVGVGNAAGKTYYAAWSAMRYMAVGLLLLIGLVMVVSQMIGIGPFDAYTVKKVLPRMLAAAILITLSWFLCKFVIDIFNVLGQSVRGLIYAPFGGSQQLATDLSTALSSGSGGTQGAFAGAAVGGYFLVATTNWIVILTFALPALIAVLVGFFFIVIRKVVIILMVILSPLAVVAFILPGTDKAWKLWHENFSRALIMYPLIMAFLSAGRVVADVTLHDTGGGAANQIIALIVYFGPYFAIPATFKMAGGLLATATGAAQDRTRGLLDRNKKLRQKNQAETWANTRAGNRFKGNNAFSRKASGIMGYTSNLNRAGLNPKNMRRSMRAALAERDLAGMQENMEKNASFRPFIGNDTLLNAATAGKGTEADARAYLESEAGGRQSGAELQQNLAHISAAKRSMGDRQFAMAAAVANAGTGTGYGNGPGEMLEKLVQASGGDMAIAGNLLAQAKSKAEGARRYDLSGAGFGDMYSQMQAIGRAQTPADAAQASTNATDYLTDRALDANGPGAMLGGRGLAVRNMAPAMQRRITAANTALADARTNPGVADSQGRTGHAKLLGAERQWKQTMASTAGLLDVASQVSPENARVLADHVMAMPTGAPGTDEIRTVGQHLDSFREDAEFGQMRREQSEEQRRQYLLAQQELTGGGLGVGIGPATRL